MYENSWIILKLSLPSEAALCFVATLKLLEDVCQK